jgi:hypothetical protein
MIIGYNEFHFWGVLLKRFFFSFFFLFSNIFTKDVHFVAHRQPKIYLKDTTAHTSEHARIDHAVLMSRQKST